MSAGTYEVAWTGVDETGRKVASGVYIYRLEVGEFVESKILTLIK